MKRLPKFQTGTKFGKLTILDVQKGDCALFAICKCVCEQIVLISDSQFQNQSKTSCQNCEASKQKFRSNDIAILVGGFSPIPRGEQVIVEEQIKKGLTVKVEYKGKHYLVHPGNLKSSGINFYDRRRRKIKNRFDES